MFAGRIKDLVLSSEYSVRTTGFLSPLEQREAFEAASSTGAGMRCFFWGGVPETERRALVMVPDWMTPAGVFGGAFDPEREDALWEMILSGGDGGEVSGVICPIEISASGYEAPLSHRDYLGALLGLGLERDTIGDIAITGDFGAVVFVLERSADFIVQNLVKVGASAVKAGRTCLPEGFRVPREFEVITDTVMSVRLDGVIRALCKISREAASSLVEKGDVTLNYAVETKTDREIKKGDVLSVKGYGKYIYDGDRGVNRRGRIRIDARKYL